MDTAQTHRLRTKAARDLVARVLKCELVEDDVVPGGTYQVTVTVEFGGSDDERPVCGRRMSTTEELASLSAGCRLVARCDYSRGQDVCLVQRDCDFSVN